jgi:hypothetical protein
LVQLESDWVSAPSTAVGQDHLATQAVSARMFGELVPAITTVTDRAACYTFYPWLFLAAEQRRGLLGLTFEQLVRRAECLFTLAAERHAQTREESGALHGVGTVGRVRLVAALRHAEPGASLPLVRFAAPRKDAANQEEKLAYFLNPLGGLAQYCLGPLLELGVLARHDGHPACRKERGEPLAKAMDLRSYRT